MPVFVLTVQRSQGGCQVWGGGVLVGLFFGFVCLFFGFLLLFFVAFSVFISLVSDGGRGGGGGGGLCVCWWVALHPSKMCISGADLLKQLHLLPHCKSNFLSHPVTVY